MKPVIQNAERFGRDNILPFLLKILFPAKKKLIINAKPSKILLVKTHHKIGDLLLGTPLIHNLKKHYPRAEIDFLAGEYCQTAVLDHPDLNRVYTFKKRPIPSNLFYDIKTILQLRKKKYDICLAVSASSFSVTNGLIARFCEAKLTIGLEGPNAKQKKITDILYDLSATLPSPQGTETDLYLRPLSILKVPIHTKDELMGLTRADTDFAKSWIKNLALPPKSKLIGIHPGGTYKEKQWGIEKLIQLISLIRKNKNGKVILFTGKNEQEFISPLTNKFSDLTVIPDVNFKRLAALQAEMDLFLANDTGTLHSACAVDVPTIGFYMTTSADQWAPLNKKLIKLHSPDVKTVFAHINKILKSHSTKRKAR